MPLCVKESATWRNITTQCINQSGTWRRVVDGCINQAGTYRCFGMSVPTGSLSLSPSSIARSGGEGGTSTLTWSSTKATCVVSVTNFSTAATSGTLTVCPSSTTTYCIVFGNPFGNSTAATATLTVSAPTLGSSFGGGCLICRASSTNWIAAPGSADVNRTWYSRAEANTRAQQVSGCTGWFVPSCSQLKNPGFTCRTYWNPCGGNYYWSNSPRSAGGWALTFQPPNLGCDAAYQYARGNYVLQIRSFRTVSY